MRNPFQEALKDGFSKTDDGFPLSELAIAFREMTEGDLAGWNYEYVAELKEIHIMMLGSNMRWCTQTVVNLLR